MFAYSPYAALTDSEKALRAQCYPNYSEYTSEDIPSVSGLPMLNVDTSQLTIQWAATIPSELSDYTWVYRAEESPDDGHSTGLRGFEADVSFQSRAVSNTLVYTTSD